MRSVLAPAVVAALATITCARALAAFIHQARELTAMGRLPVRRHAYVPVLVPSHSHAAVYVGARGALPAHDASDDIDDMGLLARAMTKELRPRRPLVEQIAAGPAAEFPADLFEPVEAAEEPVRALATIAAATAVLCGIPAIVRPLEAWAPILAGVAIVFGAAAWWLSRRP